MKHNNQERYKNYIIAVLFVIAGIVLDQWSKYLVVAHLKDKSPMNLIPGVFQLAYLENRGAAFGLLQNQRILFLISTAIILCLIVWFYAKVPMTKHFLPLRICAIMIAAGAIGNLIDRVRLNYVVDFFYFELIDFPIFNVADIFVTVSMFLLVFLILFYYKEEDFDKILHH